MNLMEGWGMEFLLILVVVVVIYLVIKGVFGSGGADLNQRVEKNSGVGKNKKPSGELEQWLLDRWALADAQEDTGQGAVFGSWYFDSVTEFQLKKLEELDVNMKGDPTKGQASDLIGLYEKPEPESLQVLKFFKVPVRGMSETKAKHEVGLIFSDDKNVQAWDARPVIASQKEFFKFFGIKLSKGMTHDAAKTFISKHTKELRKKSDPVYDDWLSYEDILQEIADSDFRDTYEIKKPSATLVKKALKELLDNDMSYADIADDIDILVDKLTDLKPELHV